MNTTTKNIEAVAEVVAQESDKLWGQVASLKQNDPYRFWSELDTQMCSMMYDSVSSASQNLPFDLADTYVVDAVDLGVEHFHRHLGSGVMEKAVRSAFFDAVSFLVSTHKSQEAESLSASI